MKPMKPRSAPAQAARQRPAPMMRHRLEPRSGAQNLHHDESSMSKLTYDHFTRTGYQDCGNAFDVSEHREAWRKIGKPRGASAARNVVRAAWGDDAAGYEDWIDQNDVGEMIQDGLEPRAAYTAWRDAWQSCAETAVRNRLPEWIKRDEESR